MNSLIMATISPISLTVDHPLVDTKKKSCSNFDKIQSRILLITAIFAVLVTIGTLLIGLLLNIPVIYFLTGISFIAVVLSNFILYKRATTLLKPCACGKHKEIKPKRVSTNLQYSSISIAINRSKENWEHQPKDLQNLPAPSALLTDNPYEIWKAKHSLFSLVSLPGGNPEHLLISASENLGKTLLIEETSQNAPISSYVDTTPSPKSLLNEAIQETRVEINTELPAGDSGERLYWQPDFRGRVFLPQIPTTPEAIYQYYYALYVTYIQTAINTNTQIIQIPLYSLREHLYSRELPPQSRMQQSLAMITAVKYMAELHPEYPLTIACVERSLAQLPQESIEDLS
ncbi:hypothetical protein CPK_ORF00873 [Chlamydia pneumoniae LPCoLN]|nr:hypothetical protein [Chlamydia pneumoniae]ACZ33340.1 hypothetical protein CPK_ORF00873 [Chlamydia pneumoniae LPCoLN]